MKHLVSKTLADSVTELFVNKNKDLLISDINICETSGADKAFTLWIAPSLPATDVAEPEHMIFKLAPIKANETMEKKGKVLPAGWGVYGYCATTNVIAVSIDSSVEG